MKALMHFIPGCDESHFRKIWPKWHDSRGALQGIMK